MKAFEIQNFDLAAAVIDDAFALKRVRDRPDAGSLNSEEMRQKLLGELHLTVA